MSQSKYRVEIDTNSNTSHALMLRLIGGGKRVLDLGCAEGDLARALQARGCRVSGVEIDPAAADKARPNLDRCVVADLARLDLVDTFQDQRFDAVVFGDVLEHLAEPLPLLRRAKELLARGGFIVISIPNVAHASVRLALLRGEWRYRPLGLLDETHLRFFTRSTLLELLAEAGLAPLEMLRTTAGPFETELALRPEDFPEAIVQTVLQDKDASTYQFVLTAAPDDADARVRRLSERAERLEQQLSDVREREQRVAMLARQSEQQRIDEERREWEARERAALERLERLQQVAVRRRESLLEAQAESEELRQELVALRAELALSAAARAAAEATVAAMLGSTSWRLAAPVRRLAPLRAALQGPVAERTSLRSAGGLRHALARVREKGLHGTLDSARRALAAPGRQADYLEWVARHDTVEEDDRRAIRRHLAVLPIRPLLSVLMPVYDTDPTLLRAALDSLSSQLYENWELCVVDDHSPTEQAWRILLEYAERDPRFRPQRRDANGGIAAATNTALAEARGEHVVLMDHDDVLPEHALYMVAVELIRHPETDLLFSDEDKLDREGRRADPCFKPDFNPELLLGQNCVSHLGCIRTSLLRDLGGLRDDVEGSQDHDLVLRVVERTEPERIRHLPFVLYHWRQWSGSGTFSSANLDRAAAASRRAVQEHLDRVGERAHVEANPVVPTWNRVRWDLPEELPEVTVVVPTRDRLDLLRNCVTGLLEQTEYGPLRVLIVDNDSQEQETLDYLDHARDRHQVEVLPVPGPFNYSALNNQAVERVESPLVLLLNNDVMVRHPDWLREMVSLVLRRDVAVVGAKLLYADERVQHGGVLLGVGGVANHAHLLFDGRSPGYFGRLALLQEVSAVTGACMLTRREVFRELGGLDETNLPVAFNDIDYCLRARSAGWRVLWTPHAELFHLESVSRGLDVHPEQVARFQREVAYMQSRWAAELRCDFAYNPNLSDVRPDFSLAAEPRVNKPWAPYLR